MTLAQRVRDFRYAKGWGPDELASRAEISRTALYQIESGKTGLPRAGTLRRIALALDVSMDDLLGHAEAGYGPAARPAQEAVAAAAWGRGLSHWVPSEGGPLTLRAGGSPPHVASSTPSRGEDARASGEPHRRAVGDEEILIREGEMMSKLHDLLHSSLGTGVARILDDLHLMLARGRNSS